MCLFTNYFASKDREEFAELGCCQKMIGCLLRNLFLPINASFVLWAIFITLVAMKTKECTFTVRTVNEAKVIEDSLHTKIVLNYLVQIFCWIFMFCLMPCIKAYCVSEEPFLYKPVNEEQSCFLKYCFDQFGILGTWRIKRSEVSMILKILAIGIVAGVGFFIYQLITDWFIDYIFKCIIIMRKISVEYWSCEQITRLPVANLLCQAKVFPPSKVPYRKLWWYF